MGPLVVSVAVPVEEGDAAVAVSHGMVAGSPLTDLAAPVHARVKNASAVARKRRRVTAPGG